MGASYIAIGDHDLSLDEILSLPVRLAPVSLSVSEHLASVNISIGPVHSPPPPLREARVWDMDGVGGSNDVHLAIGRRSFSLYPHGTKLLGFLINREFRDEGRRVARVVAGALGARRLVFCTDFNSTWGWDALERGQRVDDVVAYLTGEHGQRSAGWDEVFDEQECLHNGLAPPFFLDEWT